MLILAIETSCDETAASVVEDGTRVLSNVIASSMKSFQEKGGVIPEEAARKQVECIQPVINKAMHNAGVCKEDIDAIAVTRGPGLLVSLLVGTTVARTLASIWGKPLIGVHHTLGHLSSTWLNEPQQKQTQVTRINEKRKTKNEKQFPILTLSASGGHTDLWLRISHTKGKLLGRTRDDAAGEAFDKGAQLLGLPYPGGPAISKAAEKGNSKYYDFPLPLHDDDSLDFSFSGLKTSLKYLLRDLATSYPFDKLRASKLQAKNKHADVAASYQHSLCVHLVDRIIKAIKQHPEVREVHLVGGVSANIHLRKLVTDACVPLTIRTPKLIPYCTDNAAMIGAAAFFLFKEKGEDAFEEFETETSLPLREVVRE